MQSKKFKNSEHSRISNLSSNSNNRANVKQSTPPTSEDRSTSSKENHPTSKIGETLESIISKELSNILQLLLQALE